MITIDREYVTEIFDRYVSNYDINDKKIKLKAEHTYRVADNCDNIARELGMCRHDVDISWLIGMLHDIGRFEQVKRYGTFVDAKSIDHAEFGCTLLFDDGLMDIFIPEVKDGKTYDDEMDIIKKAIWNHSGFRIEKGLDEKTNIFCKIIRDADKIDIFRVIYETPMEDIYNYNREIICSSVLTEEVKKNFLEEHTIPRIIKKTPADIYLSHIALAFELEYECSRMIAEEQGYLMKMFDYKWTDENTADFFKKAKKKIQKVIQFGLGMEE